MKSNFTPELDTSYFYPNPLMPDMVMSGVFTDSSISHHRASCGLCYPPTGDGYALAKVHARLMLSDDRIPTAIAKVSLSGITVVTIDEYIVGYYDNGSESAPKKPQDMITIEGIEFKLKWKD